MHNKINNLTVAIAVAAAAMSGQAVAGAFQLNEQSVSAQGNAFAGRTSNVQDASIVFGNPAGMSFLDRTQVTAGATYLDVNTDIKNSSGVQPVVTGMGPSGPTIGATPVQGTSEGDMVPGSTIPFGYYVQPINDNLHFGLGVYAPFGVITDYEDSFEGRYFGNYSEVEVVTVQPTLSIKFSDQFSAGFGVTYNSITGELESATPNPANPTVARDGTVNVQGDDEAWGFTFGLMYKPVETTTLGITYRSDVDYDLEGDIDVSNVFSLRGPINQSEDASLSITLPETIDFSVTHDLSDHWTVMAGAALVKWSSFDRLTVETDAQVQPDEAQDYEDAWQYALGLSYHVNPALTLRTGVAYDESPISDEVRTVRVPSGDRTIFSLGAGWTPTPNLTLDVAYTYLTEDTAPVSMSDPSRGTYEADYENEAHGFGAQATYRF